MKASIDNPNYSVYIVYKKKKYNITPAVIEISMSSQEKQLAMCASIKAANTKVEVTTGTGKKKKTVKKSLCQILDVRMRVFIYANDGTKKDEVFRGWLWTEYHESDMEASELTLKCYDNLIYLQESEDSFYFSKGKRTKNVLTTICKKWGIKLNYTYSSINHGKLPIKGSLSNIITDLLEKVRKRTGKKYVIESHKDVLHIKPEGTNKKVYQILRKNNATEVKWEKSMDGMTTKVKILGTVKKKNGDNVKEKEKVMATVKGNTKKYGTLQKLQTKGSDDSLAKAKKEAKTTIKENGQPAQEYTVTAPDIPWIRKGNKVYVDAGHITGKTLIVVGMDRKISNKGKTMTLTLKKKGQVQ